MSSDIKLLGYVAAALFFFMAMMLLLTLRQAGRVRGARQWLWSTLMVAIAIGLNTSQDVLPPFLGFVVSNTLIIVAPLVGARGTFDYRYHRLLPARLFYVVAVVVMSALAYFVYVAPSSTARILIVATMISGACLWHVWVMLAGSPLRRGSPGVENARFRLPHGIMVVGLLMIAGVFIIRAIDTLQSMQATAAVPPGGPQRTVLFFYLVGIIGRVLLLIGMVLVLIDELDHALRALASRDALTGLFNRRGLREATAALPLADSSLLMLDLDRFKSVNDDFGHEQGDRVIALLARCAQAHLPTTAVLARLGGEEFCALLPGTDLAAATACAEGLRVAFQRETAALGHSRPHTVSVGVAGPASGATLATLLERADQALYRAKRNGRNRFEIAAVEPAA